MTAAWTLVVGRKDVRSSCIKIYLTAELKISAEGLGVECERKERMKDESKMK